MKVLKYLTKCFSREGFSQSKSNKKLHKSNFGLIWWTDSKLKQITEVRAKHAIFFLQNIQNLTPSLVLLVFCFLNSVIQYTSKFSNRV